MAKEIMVTPQELRARARELRNYKEAHENVMNRITNLVGSVCTVWRGSAQDAFVAKYMGMKPSYTNFAQALEQHAALMEETADRLEQKDNSLGSRISNI